MLQSRTLREVPGHPVALANASVGCMPGLRTVLEHDATSRRRVRERSPCSWAIPQAGVTGQVVTACTSSAEPHAQPAQASGAVRPRDRMPCVSVNGSRAELVPRQRTSCSAVLPARVPPCASSSGSAHSPSTSKELSAPLLCAQHTRKVPGRRGVDELLASLGLQALCRDSKRRARGLTANAMTAQLRFAIRNKMRSSFLGLLLLLRQFEASAGQCRTLQGPAKQSDANGCSSWPGNPR